MASLLFIAFTATAEVDVFRLVGMKQINEEKTWLVYDLDGDNKTDYATRTIKNGVETLYQTDGKTFVIRWETEKDKRIKKIFRKDSASDFVLEKETVFITYKDKVKVFDTVFYKNKYAFTTKKIYDQSMAKQRESIRNSFRSAQTDMSGQCRRAEVLTIGMEVLRLVRDTIGSTGEDKVKVVNSLMEDSIDNIVIDQCGDEFKEDIIRPALKRGLSCLTNLGGNGPSYAAQIIGLLQNRDNMNPLNVKCGSDQADSLGIPESARNISPQEYVNGLANGSITARPSATGAAALTCDGDWPKVSMFPGNGVGINPDKRFSAEELKKQQQATFFHELFHNLGFYHNSGAVDLTYICTFSCFSDHTYKKIAKDAPNFNDTRFESTVHEAKRLCRTAESTPRRSPGENWRTSVASSGYTNGTFANGRILHDVLKFSTGAASIAMNSAFLYYVHSFAERIDRYGLIQQSGIE